MVEERNSSRNWVPAVTAVGLRLQFEGTSVAAAAGRAVPSTARRRSAALAARRARRAIGPVVREALSRGMERPGSPLPALRSLPLPARVSARQAD